MPPEPVSATQPLATIPDTGPAQGLPAQWRRPLAALGAVALAQFLIFGQDWRNMAAQWWNSSTYAHILLIPPVLAWLVWQRWPQLRLLSPSPWWPGAALFALALLGWMLAAATGLSLLRHAAAVAMLGATVLALLGPRVGYGLAFPLGYMGFLVPFGDELIPPLQTVTAILTIGLVQLSGIPAAIDGVFIDTPAGLFEVAEACSGVKFLIAMVAFGVLAAHLCFTSLLRRATFVALCVVVPVLANGGRAWGTIAIAQSKGVEWASGFDHVIYGWFFFAAVIGLVITAGWRFFDRRPDDPLIDPVAIQSSSLLARLARRRIAMPLALFLLLALPLAGQGWASTAERLAAPLPGQIHLPDVPGWQRVDYAPQIAWQPRASGADHRLMGRYADSRGRTVDVFVALYSGQSDGREAGGFGEGALPPDTGWAWLAAGAPAPGGRSERLLGNGRVERVAETYYRTGAVLTGSNLRLKLANMADRLRLRARPTTLLILSSEASSSTLEPAQAVVAFRSATGPLGPWMDRMAQVR